MKRWAAANMAEEKMRRSNAGRSMAMFPPRMYRLWSLSCLVMTWYANNGTPIKVLRHTTSS